MDQEEETLCVWRAMGWVDERGGGGIGGGGAEVR